MLPIDSTFWLNSCYRLLFLFWHYSFVNLSFVFHLVAHLFSVGLLSTVSHLWFYRYYIFSQFPYCDGSHNSHNNTSGDNVGPLIIKKKEWRVTTLLQIGSRVIVLFFCTYTGTVMQLTLWWHCSHDVALFKIFSFHNGFSFLKDYPWEYSLKVFDAFLTRLCILEYSLQYKHFCSNASRCKYIYLDVKNLFFITQNKYVLHQDRKNE